MARAEARETAPAGPRRSDLVHDRLRRDILEGRLEPGDAVPSERVLAEDLGVNRHAVREALKRLEQAGLVRISQGGATRVLDWRQSGGLEILLDLLAGGGTGTDSDPTAAPPAELVRAVLELRAAIGTDAAARCAQRAPAAARDAIAGLAQDTAAAVGTDPELLDERYGELWEQIVVGSGNVAYRLALNSLLAALNAYPRVAQLVLPRDAAAVRALGAAIAAAQPVAAGAAAQALLGADAAAA